MHSIAPETFIRLSGSQQQISDSLGPLADLAGTWVGSKGWNIIAVPKPGSQPDAQGDFQLLVRPYTETITFAPVGAPVRNRGGALDQFVGGLEYDLHISDRDTGEVLHVENGMWLYLGDIQPTSGTGAAPGSEYTIARSATIPHGNATLILGGYTVALGAPKIPKISSLPPDTGTCPPLGYLDPYLNGSQPGITISNPNTTLQADLHGQDIVSTTTITLDSQNQGGISSIPFIAQRANPTRFRAILWIETVKVPNSNQTFQQLQYSQIVDLEFHHKFHKKAGNASDLISWPHVNINTLRKQ